MIGWMVLEERRGWRSTVEEVRLEGLRVCRAGIPAPAALSPAARNRRVKRGAQLLRKAGCRRCLTRPGFPLWDLLHESGLQAVDPGGLCQALAARLAGTIPYELMCDVNPRVPRVYLPEDRAEA